MTVRIRMKKMGRKHRAFFRICAIDKRSPRDGRVLEELGTYDPSIPEKDARAVLKADRVDYWLGVGAQPSDKVSVLIKKYGTNGSHVTEQTAALNRMAQPSPIPDPGTPASLPKKPEPEAPKPEAANPEAATESPSPEAPAGDAPATEKPAEEAKAKEEAPAETEASTAEKSTEEKGTEEKSE